MIGEILDKKIEESIDLINPETIAEDEALIDRINGLMKARKSYADSEATLGNLEISSYKETELITLNKQKEKNRHAEELKKLNNEHQQALVKAESGPRDSIVIWGKVIEFIFRPMTEGLIKGGFKTFSNLVGYSIINSGKIFDPDVLHIMKERADDY